MANCLNEMFNNFSFFQDSVRQSSNILETMVNTFRHSNLDTNSIKKDTGPFEFNMRPEQDIQYDKETEPSNLQESLLKIKAENSARYCNIESPKEALDYRNSAMIIQENDQPADLSKKSENVTCVPLIENFNDDNVSEYSNSSDPERLEVDMSQVCSNELLVKYHKKHCVQKTWI